MNASTPPYEPPDDVEELARRYASGERTFHHSVLRGGKLSGLDLRNIDLSGSKLLEVTFEGCILEGARFTNAKRDDVTAEEEERYLEEWCEEAGQAWRVDDADYGNIDHDPDFLSSRDAYFVRDAELHDVQFIDSDLRNALFTRASLHNVFHRGCQLRGATYEGATFDRVRFIDIDLSSADFSTTSFASDRTVIVDNNGGEYTERRTLDACVALGRIPGGLLRLLANAGDPTGFVTHFDQRTKTARVEESERRPMTAGPGLLMYFDKRLSALDRVLVDGLIYAVLGKETDCRVVEFSERGGMTHIRLEASRQEDLESFAEALFRRVWDQFEQQEQALSQFSAKLDVTALHTSLSALADKLAKMELRMPSPDGIERLNELGAQHIEEKHLKIVQTWEQKVAQDIKKKIGEKVGKNITEHVTSIIEDMVRGGTKPGNGNSSAE